MNPHERQVHTTVTTELLSCSLHDMHLLVEGRMLLWLLLEMRKEFFGACSGSLRMVQQW